MRYFRIPPGVSCLVPTGIKVDVPPGHMLEVKNKSGIAHKQKLLVGACVVDSGYTGRFLSTSITSAARQGIYPQGKKLLKRYWPRLFFAISKRYSMTHQARAQIVDPVDSAAQVWYNMSRLDRKIRRKAAKEKKKLAEKRWLQR